MDHGNATKAVGLFDRAHDHAHVELHTVAVAPQIDALKNGRLDVGVVRAPVNGAALAAEVLLLKPFVAPLARHRLAKKKSIALSPWPERAVRSPAATSRCRVPRSCAESVPRTWIYPQRSSRSGSRPTNAWDGCGRHGHRAGACVRSPSEQTGLTCVTLRPPHVLLETVVTLRRNETSPFVEQVLNIARQLMVRS